MNAPRRPFARRIPRLLVVLPVAGAALVGLAGRAGATEVLEAPRLARDLRFSGDVVVEALVDSAGTVRATNLLLSHPVLDDSACLAVAARRFEPARDSLGRPVASIRTVPLRFESPRAPDVPFSHHAEERCEYMRFALDLDPRPDSTGRVEARWTAAGSRAYELRLLVLAPDGVVVDTTGSALPQRLLDSDDAPGWPAWGRRGKQLKAGTGGTLALDLPGSPWWTAGRIAFVALFHDVLDREWVLRQAVFRIERDEMGPLLVRDARVPGCLAGPGRRLGPASREALPATPREPSGAGEKSIGGRR